MMLPFFRGSLMAGGKGFSLMEILIVLIVLGIIIAVAIPYYSNSTYNSKVHLVENNLRAIGAAQQKYHEDHGSYYASSDFGAINSNLSLSLASANNGFSYTCAASGTCLAQDPNMTVSVDANGNITCSTGPCP